MNLAFNKNQDMKELNEIIVKNIKKYRKKRKMTQKELSLKCELSHQYIRRIESSKGEKSFSLETIYKISRVLEINIIFFFLS